MDGETFEARPRPGIIELLAKLAGGTTYREPLGGTSSKHGDIPAEHEMAAAVAAARRKDDPLDIGPDLIYDEACQRAAHNRRVVSAVVFALEKGECRHMRIVRRNLQYLSIVVHCAYLRSVFGQSCQRPDGMGEGDWDALTDSAERIMGAMRDEASPRVARFLFGRA